MQSVVYTIFNDFALRGANRHWKWRTPGVMSGIYRNMGWPAFSLLQIC